MRSEVLIRSYEPRDRSAVRVICCETADRGGPIERVLSDREVVADFLTRYYTDYEPAASWVAEQEGRVIGYLTGSLDSRRYWRVTRWRIGPAVTIHALRRGMLWRWETWRLLCAALITCWRGGFSRYVPLDRYPTHLHVNVRQGYRAQHVGRRLLERFVAQVKDAGRRGIHASVREDNAPACRLFERMGFAVLSRHPVTLPDETGFRAYHTVIYGKTL